MENQQPEKEAIFYEKNAWYYVAKIVNFSNYTIEYEKKGGFATCQEAEQQSIKEKELFKKQIARIKKLTNMKYTLMEYLDHWYRTDILPNVCSSIKIGYCWTVYSIIFPNLKRDVLLGMVTTQYLNDLLKNCAGYCDSAGAMVQKVLRIALKDAIDDGYIKNNPLPAMDKYYWNPPKLVILTKAQIKILLQAAYESHSHYLEILLALFAGLRKGEIMGLAFTDFNFSLQTVTIGRQITRNYEVIVKDDFTYKTYTSEQSAKPPKSLNSYRTLRIHSIIFDELRIREKENEELFAKLPADAQKWKGYVCIGPKGNIKSDGTINAALDRICIQNGLPHITVHDLRHMFATILIEQGMPLEKISKLLGHKSVATTFEIYCGIIEGKEQISKLINSTFDPVIAAATISEEAGGEAYACQAYC